MLIDNSLVLSQEQSVKTSCASENTVDQAAAGQAHTHAAFLVRVDETFAGASAVKISLQTADDAAFASPKELFSASFTAADLKAGKTVLQAVLPQGLLRYLRGYYTVTGSGTAGKLSLFITDPVDM